ncbi:retrovirus-related pol polyprotein from transposon TNT 1-94 [Tanacetum coccineum]
MKCTLIGSGLDEMRYSFRDTKSHQVIRSRDITFVDFIYAARSVTDSSSLTKPIQKSQVVLVDIPENLADNDSIIILQGGRLQDSIVTKIYQRVQGSSKWKKAIIEEMVSLEKNQTYSLVTISAGKKASQRLWMFKVKEEQNDRKRFKARLVVKGFQQKQGVDYNEIFSPVVKMTTIRVLIFAEDSWNEEPCRDVHQVGDEKEVEFLRSFNWPPSELITEDSVLPERGYSQFNDVSSGYLRVPDVRRYRKVRAVALLKGRWFEVYRDYLRRRAVK